MAKIDQIPKDKIAVAFAKAKSEPKRIQHPIDVVLELIRWGASEESLRAVIDDIANVDQINTAKKLRDDSLTKLGFALEPTGLAVWAEIDAANLDQDMPAEWEAPEVSEGETSRPRKWSEAHMLIERDGRYFCPCSDGVEYFLLTKIEAVEPYVLDVLDIADLPEAQNEPI